MTWTTSSSKEKTVRVSVNKQFQVWGLTFQVFNMELAQLFRDETGRERKLPFFGKVIALVWKVTAGSCGVASLSGSGKVGVTKKEARSSHVLER